MTGGAAKRVIFSRRLSRTSVQKRLPVPPRCLRDLPDFHGGHAVEMKVICENEVYPVACTTRTTGKYAKPVLSKGWTELARKSKLKVGDQVNLFKLHKPQEDGASYVMEIERAVAVSVPVLIRQEAADQADAAATSDNWDSEESEQIDQPASKLKIFGVWFQQSQLPLDLNSIPISIVPVSGEALDLTLKLAV